MQCNKILLPILIYLKTYSYVHGVDDRKFPKDFVFGVATASYQIEGAWNEDGKSENIWDHLTHNRPEIITDESNGDIACDSYHKIDTDIALLKKLGVNFYRFSISWARILPTGDTDFINYQGMDYYDELLEKLKNNGIDAMVTLYHWDLPQTLQDTGGWLNQTIVDKFRDYAAIVFQFFGDRVKYWSTFNEPYVTCFEGYETATKAPALRIPGLALYQCAHNVLKAHAKVYHLYVDEFQKSQQGRISIVIDADWYEPSGNDVRDFEAAERMQQFRFGWFAHPIIFGNYPRAMIDRIGERSEKEGLPKSRLPEFTEEEIEYIKGTYDYIGLNHYTTNLIEWREDYPIGEPSNEADLSVYTFQDDSWQDSASSWLKVVPWGIRKLLKWIKDNYNNPEIIITENGVSDAGDTLEDSIRTNYYRDYLSNTLQALYDDECRITGYTAWSLMDNFEWNAGYTEKFGLYSVNFTDPARTRTPKASVTYFRKVIATKCLTDTCE